MLSTEREIFDEHLEVLFGGFTGFLTDPRREAYWRGLQKMPLSVFVRCVDQVLGETGQEKLPTVNTLWQVSRNLRAASANDRPSVLRSEPLDIVHAYGNRALLWWLRKHGSVSASSLQKIIAAKKQTCDAYALITQEEPEAGAELRDKLFAEWDALREPMPAAELASGYERFERMHHV
jgi:hypothetical protein